MRMTDSVDYGVDKVDIGCNFRVLVTSHFGLAYVLLVEINFFPNKSLFFRTLLIEHPSVLSQFCFAKIEQIDLELVCIYMIMTLFAFHTNKKQYLDTLHVQKLKKIKLTIGCTIMTLIYSSKVSNYICKTTNPKIP